jgi:hypothetical protein
VRRALQAAALASAMGVGPTGAGQPAGAPTACVRLDPIGASDKPLPAVLVCPVQVDARAAGEGALVVVVTVAPSAVERVGDDVRRHSSERQPTPAAYGTYAARLPARPSDVRYLTRDEARGVLERLVASGVARPDDRDALRRLVRRLE